MSNQWTQPQLHAHDRDFAAALNTVNHLADCAHDCIYHECKLTRNAQDDLLNRVVLLLLTICPDEIIVSRHRGEFGIGPSVRFFPTTGGEYS